MDVPVYNMSGKEVGQFTVDEVSLGGEVNPALLKQAFVRYHANRRQGSARTRTRANIAGSTKKMYRQKGTGRARHSTSKVSQFRGGGTAKAKTRTHEDYRQDMPKKMRRKANRNALLAKLVDNEVRIIDDLKMGSPSTKDFVTFLKAIKIDRTVLVALTCDPEGSRNTRLSSRNIEDVTLCRSDQLNVYEMLNHRYLVIGRSELEAWLAGPSSQTGKEAKTDPMGRVESGEAA